jgi:superfamily II RNA helicase
MSSESVKTSFLEIADTKQDAPQWPLKHPAKVYSYPLDPFQQHAIVGIEDGKNILVTAKTGSGKTLVGEYLIHKIFRDGGRIFYTTPIKSLSNQKFHELKKEFGVDKVGIMTGDIKFNPDAQVIVMTTEILRNLLFKRGTSTEQLGLTSALSLKGLQGVVFDEVHYINDKDRGRVWEETLILLPPEIQIVMLSATIDRPELFAEWLGKLKQKPIVLLSTQYRVVPLTHGVLMGQQFQTLMDAKEMYNDATYRQWLDWRKTKEKDHEAFQRKVKEQRAAGFEGPVDGKTRPQAFIHQLNETVLSLERQKLLPALCFVFSRNGCEKYADKISTSLVDSSEAAAIRHIWNFHLHKYKDLETLPQAIALRALVEKGIAYHHSGLLPVLKEIIEILFGRGLIRLLFATETFAVGLNMPTKTVLFLALEKYSDGGLRSLRTDEYIQMAGRAGRRGLDPIGTVIYLPDREPVEPGQMKAIMTGGRSPIVSKMSFHYDFILKSLQANTITWLGLMETSYWFKQRQQSLETSRKQVANLEAKYQSYGYSEQDVEDAWQKDELEAIMKTAVNAKKKDAQRKLEQFKNSHVGPKWENLWRQWLSIKATDLEIRGEKAHVFELEKHTATIQPVVDFLFQAGYLNGEAIPAQELTKESLSKKGVMATEINEGHSILMTELYTRKLAHDLSGEEILTLLAGFLKEDSNPDKMPFLDSMKIPSTLKTTCYEIGDIAVAFSKLEKRLGVESPDAFWDMNTFWMTPIWLWLEGEELSTICSQLDIFAGNLVRAIHKVANLLEEWTTLATLEKDIPMLEKLRGMDQKLKEGVALTDSLYLRL